MQNQEYISKEQLDLLNFYRSEVKHEFTLLSTRLNLLITCQSFLVVPFAILHNSANFKIVFIPSLLVIILGAYTSWLIRKPLNLTQKLIREWLVKQRRLLNSIHNNEYKSTRDMILDVDQDTTKDTEHEHSLAFSKQAPLVFLMFWILAFIWTLLRLILGI